MTTRPRLRVITVTLVTMLVALIGMVKPAKAEVAMTENTGNNFDQAHLTKVVSVPSSVLSDANKAAQLKNDVFTFKFDKTVAQDSSVEVNDVPAIGDKTISNIQLGGSSSTGGTDTFKQVAGQLSLNTIFNGVSFPHAGVYTYGVSELPGATNLDGVFVNYSRASYTMKVYVENNEGSDATTNPTRIKGVTIDKDADDDGVSAGGKSDPLDPVVSNGWIQKEDHSASSNLENHAGDDRGRNVQGFTFANEYLVGTEFKVTKLTQGQYADKTKRFTITITLVDGSAPDDSIIVYDFSSEAAATASSAVHVDNLADETKYMVKFNNHVATITAKLADGEYVSILGLYGTPDANQSFNGNEGDHRQKFATGLKQDTTFEVKEIADSGYTASGYLSPGSTPSATVENSAYVYTPSDGRITATGSLLTINGTQGDTNSNIYVLNVRDIVNTNPTGIIINNLPYILMVGVPVAVFAFLFVRKRQQHTSV